jgi:predicted nucleic acid-binding Zn ribbon protein
MTTGGGDDAPSLGDSDSTTEPAHSTAAEAAKVGFTSLGDSLETFVRNLGAPPISVLTQLDDRWPELVGPGLASATRPVELIDGVLTVACDDSAWASQISWMEGQIKKRFDATFGSGLLRRVTTRVR